MACSEEGSDFMVPGETCTICLEQIHVSNGGKGFAKLRCGHIFHLCCIGSEFNCKAMMQCPNCRTTEESDWLYSAPHTVMEEISFDDAEEVMSSIMQAAHLLPCPCPCHEGHGHVVPGHGAHNTHAVTRVSRGRNVQGNGINRNQQPNVEIGGSSNNVSYDATSADRRQTRPNRRRARDTEATNRPRRRTRLMTSIYDDPLSTLVNPNTNGGGYMRPILNHPVYVIESLPEIAREMPMDRSVNQITNGGYMGPMLRRPVLVPETILEQVIVPTMTVTVGQNTIGGYVGPILSHLVPVPMPEPTPIPVPVNLNANASRVSDADDHLLELRLSPPGQDDMLELRLQPPGM